MEIDTIFQLFFLSPIRVEKSIVYTYVPNKRGIAYIDVRSEDFFPSESYEIGVLAPSTDDRKLSNEAFNV